MPVLAQTKERLRQKLFKKQVDSYIANEIINSKLGDSKDTDDDFYDFDGMNCKPLPASIVDLLFEIMKKYPIEGISLKMQDQREFNLSLSLE